MTLIDLHMQDKFGKTARDYSHKIVFMSKLLSQACSRQIWLQAGLDEVKAQYQGKKDRNGKPNVNNSKLSPELNSRNSVLATYDKLISHF